ncbi:MAG: type II secretion system F family protein [Tissierellia bacterium]|nr:type II secretion system F family protein [Tissierellia bacterium]
MFKKNKKYIPKKGLYSDVVDYGIYRLSVLEIITAILLGGGLAFLAMYIIFRNAKVSSIFSLFGIIIGLKKYKEYLFTKRNKQILLQFKDFLESLNTSLSVGKNTSDSLKSSYEDITFQHGKEAIIAKEISVILEGLNNGFTVEELLENMSERIPLDDIKNFVITFNTVNRQGGNLYLLINETKQIISQKIEVELEIQTIVHEQQNQVKILLFMPFVIIMMIDGMGIGAASKMSGGVIITRIAALIFFAAGYFLAKKIMKIEV